MGPPGRAIDIEQRVAEMAMKRLAHMCFYVFFPLLTLAYYRHQSICGVAEGFLKYCDCGGPYLGLWIRMHV